MALDAKQQKLLNTTFDSFGIDSSLPIEQKTAAMVDALNVMGRKSVVQHNADPKNANDQQTYDPIQYNQTEGFTEANATKVVQMAQNVQESDGYKTLTSLISTIDSKKTLDFMKTSATTLLNTKGKPGLSEIDAPQTMVNDPRKFIAMISGAEAISQALNASSEQKPSVSSSAPVAAAPVAAAPVAAAPVAAAPVAAAPVAPAAAQPKADPAATATAAAAAQTTTTNADPIVLFLREGLASLHKSGMGEAFGMTNPPVDPKSADPLSMQEMAVLGKMTAAMKVAAGTGKPGKGLLSAFGDSTGQNGLLSKQGVVDAVTNFPDTLLKQIGMDKSQLSVFLGSAFQKQKDDASFKDAATKATATGQELGGIMAQVMWQNFDISKIATTLGSAIHPIIGAIVKAFEMIVDAIKGIASQFNSASGSTAANTPAPAAAAQQAAALPGLGQ